MLEDNLQTIKEDCKREILELFKINPISFSDFKGYILRPNLSGTDDGPFVSASDLNTSITTSKQGKKVFKYLVEKYGSSLASGCLLDIARDNNFFSIKKVEQ